MGGTTNQSIYLGSEINQDNTFLVENIVFNNLRRSKRRASAGVAVAHTNNIIPHGWVRVDITVAPPRHATKM